jgi:hypothetical protein
MRKVSIASATALPPATARMTLSLPVAKSPATKTLSQVVRGPSVRESPAGNRSRSGSWPMATIRCRQGTSKSLSGTGTRLGLEYPGVRSRTLRRNTTAASLPASVRAATGVASVRTVICSRSSSSSSSRVAAMNSSLRR